MSPTDGFLYAIVGPMNSRRERRWDDHWTRKTPDAIAWSIPWEYNDRGKCDHKLAASQSRGWWRGCVITSRGWSKGAYLGAETWYLGKRLGYRPGKATDVETIIEELRRILASEKARTARRPQCAPSD